MTRYAQSKIANLYFTYELHRRLSAAGDSTISVAAHPGIADTELSRYVPRALRMLMPVFRPLFNTSARGRGPPVRRHHARRAGGEYGPASRRGTAGPAVKVASNRRSHDRDIARRLWDLSVEMTGGRPGSSLTVTCTPAKMAGPAVRRYAKISRVIDGAPPIPGKAPCRDRFGSPSGDKHMSNTRSSDFVTLLAGCAAQSAGTGKTG